MTAGDYLKFLLALLFVLSLMGGLTFLLRRLGYGQAVLLQGRDRHLKIIEVLPIDARHKAVLLQRDNTQHLVMLSPQGDLVIETHITPCDISVTEKTKMKPALTKTALFGPRLKKFVIANLVITTLSFILLMTLSLHPALAQQISIDLGGGEGGTVTGRVIQLVALLTILSLAPSILIMMTSFTRIIVVLSFLRTAIGIQQTPPNTVMVSLALFLTFFIMAPTLTKAYEQGLKPLMNEEIDEITAFERGVEPFKEFMLAHVRETDLELFTELSQSGPYAEPLDIPLQVVIPSFMISELRRAFEIGFMLFLPFLIIDMVTASILMSMGMMMLPPVMISLPFKIIFFVLVDGWYLISGSLVQSFGPTGPPLAGG